MTATVMRRADDGAQPSPRSSYLRRISGIAPRAVWVMSALAALVAVGLALSVFRHGSLNNDDAAYMLQARLLEHGHLTGAMPVNPEAQQPWFFAITEHGYVSKYLPSVALLYAVGLLLFGSVVPILGALAFALPLAVWGLARTVGLERHRAIVATAIVSMSPAVLIEGGLVLSYLPFLLALVVGWTLVSVVWDTGSCRAAAGLGLIAVIAASFRPLDGVVLLGPAAFFVAWRLGRRAVRPICAAIGGAAPAAALILAYDRHVTGSAFHLPFNLLSPTDAYGYGVRRLTPEDPPFDFGPAQGLRGFVVHFLTQPAGWMLGFALVLPLAVWNLRPGAAANSRVRLLAASAVVLAIAYLAFWGPWNASVLWGGPDALGPFYAIPTVVPLALAAASWWPRPSRSFSYVGVAVVGVAALVSNGITVARATDANWSAAQRTTTVLHAARDAPGTLLFDADPPYLAHPVGAIGNEPLGEGRTILLSAQLSPDQIRTVADPTLMQIVGGVYDGLNMRVLHQVRSTGTSLSLHIETDKGRRRSGGNSVVLVVSRDGEQQACTFRGAVDLTVTPSDLSGCSGTAIGAKIAAQIEKRPYRLCPTANCLSFSLFEITDSGEARVGAWRTMPLAVDGTGVTGLTDGKVISEHGNGWITVEASPHALTAQ